MSTKHKYDPEDIESLMMHKTFAQLLPDERTFVLQHLESGQEYDELRETLFNSIHAMQSENNAPSDALKEKVLAQYRAQHRGTGFGRIWLNFWNGVLSALRERPYISLATAAVLLFFGVFFWLEPISQPEVAIQSTPPNNEKVNQPQSNSAIELSEEEYTNAEKKEEPVLVMKESEEEDESSTVQKDFADTKLTNSHKTTGNVGDMAKSATKATVEYAGQSVPTMSQSENDMLADDMIDAEVAESEADYSAASAMVTDSVFLDLASAPHKNYVNTEFLALLYTAR